MNTWHNKDNFSKFRILLGLFLLIAAVWYLYHLIPALIRESSEVSNELDQGPFRMTANDFTWQNILWRLRILIMNSVLLTASGIGLLLNKKFGWLMGISTCLGLSVAYFSFLNIVSWPSMKIVHNVSWYQHLTFGIIFLALFGAIVLSKFWKRANYSIVGIVFSVALVIVILYFNSVHYLF